MIINKYLELTNEDNMELMARYPDNHFDLAIVDPPYGIDIGNDVRSGLMMKKAATKRMPLNIELKMIENFKNWKKIYVS